MAASINAAALITPTHGAAVYADEVIADEFDDMPPQLVPLVIEPMLANRAVRWCARPPKGNGLLT
jgi:hypothetical protein